MATGNTADVYKLNTGKIEIGRAADLLIMDAPQDSAGSVAMETIKIGDLPAIELIMVDGEVIVTRAVNTYQSAKTPRVIKVK
jgi:enamidase